MFRLLTFAPPIIAATLLALGYDKLPDQIPIRFGFDGTPHRFEPTTPVSVFSIPLLALLIGIMMFLPDMVRRHADTPQPTYESDKAVALPWSDSQHERTSILLHPLAQGLAAMGAATSIGLSILAVGPLNPELFKIGGLVIVIALIPGTIMLMIQMFRANSQAHKIQADANEQERQRFLNSNEAFNTVFRFGGFGYHNSLDPMTVIPQPRTTANINFNGAHRPGRIFKWGMILPLVGILALGLFF